MFVIGTKALSARTKHLETLAGCVAVSLKQLLQDKLALNIISGRKEALATALL